MTTRSSVSPLARAEPRGTVGRVAPWLPLAAAAALGVGALALEAIDARDGAPTDRLLVPIVLTYAFFGGLIASRQPRNPVGWLLSLLSLSMVGSFFISRYAVAGYDQALPLPAPGIAAALGWTWLVALACPVLIAFVAPTGRPASPAWAKVAAATAGTFALVAFVFAFGDPGYQVTGQGTAGGQDVIPNPIYVPAIRPLYDFLNAAFVIYMVLFGAAAASLTMRFRRSHGVEREQLKWIVAAIFLMLIGIAASNLLPATLSASFFALAMLPLPVSLAIAILRYRLYDIDHVISRTVSYAVLTAVLAAVYVAGFLGLQALLAPITIGEGPVPVAASTLAVFALFQPVRRRIQTHVDRRFNRSRYDAEREVERFAARVRDEVEVERVADAVAATLQRTMQPASAAIWLRTSEAR
jgi:hypothetical protein